MKTSTIAAHIVAKLNEFDERNRALGEFVNQVIVEGETRRRALNAEIQDVWRRVAQDNDVNLETHVIQRSRAPDADGVEQITIMTAAEYQDLQRMMPKGEKQ